MLTDLPRLVLHEPAIARNIAVMAEYCAANGVSLAPHAKTHLVRSLCERQLAAGAWGLTAATTVQVRQLAAWRVPRILHANVLVDAPAIAWVAAEFLGANPGDAQPEYYCYVDSPAGLALLERHLASAGATRPLNVLVEVGFVGGRTGVRDPADALRLARAAAGSPWVRLAGVAGYEGLAPGAEVIARLLAGIHALVLSCQREGLFDDVPIVTAGGSSYFDAVVEALAPTAFGFEVHTILRSGCYITHDHGVYERTSPLRDLLSPALELEASVLSQPEPGLVIVGFGRREVPTDDRMPVLLGIAGEPHSTAPAAAAPTIVDAPADPDFSEWTVFAVNDHHAYLRVPITTELEPGTVLRFGISHPCGAFDRWREIAVRGADQQLVDVMRPAL